MVCLHKNHFEGFRGLHNSQRSVLNLCVHTRHTVERGLTMVKTKNLSIEERAKIVVLVQEGYSMNRVAKMVGVSRCCVQEIMKKHKETCTVADRHRPGRPKASTARQDRELVRLCLRDRKATAPDLKCRWTEACGTTVSVQTVRRRLLNKGLRGCVAVKKPKLTGSHKRKRLEWAKERRLWTTNDWSKVLWSDESTFELWRTRGRVWVRRRQGERFLEECIVPTIKHGGGKVMVWGTMARSGVGSLTVVDGRLNSDAYIKLLKKYVKKDARKLIGRRFTFQQDGAPCHTSKATSASLAKMNICVLPWTSQSPDLNPIEHLWDHLGKVVDEMRPTSIPDLKQKLSAAWESIEPAVTQKLVDSMPSRVREVIRSRGGSTKY